MFSADLGVQAAAGGGGTQFLAVAHSGTPFITVYPWSSTTGFGTKLADPTILPTTTAYDCKFSPSGNALAVAHDGPPFINVYPWTVTGFGTKFANPTSAHNGTGFGCAFTPSGNALAVFGGGNSDPKSPSVIKFSVYQWTTGGFGSKFTNPTSLFAAEARGGAFSIQENAIVIINDSSSSSNTVLAFEWSGSGFGARLSTFAPINSAPPFNSCSFSPSGDAFAVCSSSFPFINAFRWTGTTFGTQYSSPTTIPSSASGCSFTPSGNALAVSSFGSPYITVYPWTGSGSGFGTKYSDPTSPVVGFPANACSFSPDGNSLVIAVNNTPFIQAYIWTGTGFGAKFSGPNTLPASIGRACAFGVIP